MRSWVRVGLSVTLSAWMAGSRAGPLRAETAILQIQVIEGDGAVHGLGSRSSLPLTIQVTDEVGRPVEGVAVSFRMPEGEPSGTFASGLKTEVLVTGPNGQAKVWGVQWGRSEGPVRIRITAAKGQARAGTISSQYISAITPGRNSEDGGRHPTASKPRGRWIALAVAAAGAAAGGLALGLTRQTQAAAASPAGGTAAGVSSGVQVGPPTITIGKP